MKVAIAGGLGKIALRLTRLPASGRSDVIGFIPNPAHAADVGEAEPESPSRPSVGQETRTGGPVGRLRAAGHESRRNGHASSAGAGAGRDR